MCRLPGKGPLLRPPVPIVSDTMSLIDKLFGSFSDKELKRIRPIADAVVALEPEMRKPG